MNLRNTVKSIQSYYGPLKHHAGITQLRKFGGASNPQMPDFHHKPAPYNGTKYETVLAAHKSFASPTLKPLYRTPLLLHEGRQQWLWDHNGKRYLDMFGGIATVSVGHSHPKIVKAIAEQSAKLNHVSSLYLHPRFIEYAEKLTSKFPKKLNVVYLTNSGSEANDLAFLMARVYTKKHNIISLQNCYHGGSYACSAATAMKTWKYPVVQPSGFIHSVFPDVYKGIWGGSKCRDSPAQVIGRDCQCTESECIASEKYLRMFKDVFEHNLPNAKDVAAFIAESIQGVGGTVQYPKSFLKQVYQIVRENGGLCIADEVQTGFGRTGEHFWGFQSHEIVPDIVTMAKGIGNGFPLAAVVTSTEIAESLNSGLHFNTFGGNPVACAVGSTVLDIIEVEGLQENAHVVGSYLINRLSSLISDFPDIIGDVRGKGLMIGVEFLTRNSEDNRGVTADQIVNILEDVKDMGVLIGKGGIEGTVLRIKPPMCVTKEDANFTVGVIREALERHRNKYPTYTTGR